jgi:hypothetical protein
MRLPGYVKEAGIEQNEHGEWVMLCRIRLWHPGLWLDCARDYGWYWFFLCPFFIAYRDIQNRLHKQS